jgi:serine/threonine protein kinase
MAFSVKTMFDPVLGMSRWLALARGLVEGLSWLHNCAQIIHGDIKPQNILLRPRFSCGHNAMDDIYPYDSLYVDFTSSHDLSPTHFSPQVSGSSMSALTPPFAAPELLTVSSLKSADVVPSEASDVFSLAVTLLAAVTGDLLLYPGASAMQRLAMSREGHRVLEFVRSGTHGSRLPRKGTVEKVLSSSVLKEPESRIKPDDWLQLIDHEMRK